VTSLDRNPDVELRVSAEVGRFISGKIGSPTPKLGVYQALEKRLAHRERRRLVALGALGGITVLVVGLAGYWGTTRVTGRAAGSGAAAEASRSPSLVGPRPSPGTVLGSATTQSPTEVAFPDGSWVRLEPRAHGRVLELNEDGARVALDDGRARVDVRHRPNTRWVFQAGPFEVRVHGTSFSIAWTAVAARFDLQMESGVVSVVGPVRGGEVTLRAGESLSLTVGEASAGGAGLGSRRIDDDHEGQQGENRSVGRSPIPTARSSERQRSSAEGRGMPWPSSFDWRARLVEGRARSVMAEAQRRGFRRVLNNAGSEDLAALADAARYVGDQALARRALVAQRRRFPAGDRAVEASVLLGRLDDESSAGGDRALGWYDRYLTEAPSGTYVAEALGRKMIVLERAGRREAAAAIAADYLQRFPNGSYAHAANVLLRAGGRGAAPSRTDP
jgi:hypothetical protein